MVWFIVAQILGVITLVFAFASYQHKQQRKYLFTIGISYIFWTLMFVAMGLNATTFADFIPPVVASGFGTLRSFVFWWILAKEDKRRKIAGRVFLLVFLAIALVGSAFAIMNSSPEVRPFQWIVMGTAILFVIGQYLPGKHFVRIAAVLYAISFSFASTPLYILEGNFRWNPIGLLIEASKIFSVILFYILLSRKKREPIPTEPCPRHKTHDCQSPPQEHPPQ